MDREEQSAPAAIRMRMLGTGYRLPARDEIEASWHRLAFAGLVGQRTNGFKLSKAGLDALAPRLRKAS
jgi:hypothetical protein